MNDVLSSIGQAINLAKRLREVSKNIGNAEFNNLLADLNIELADSKLSLADVMEENARLKMELTQLKHSQGSNSGELIFKEFAYYTESGDGPFCPACYDTKKQQIRLTKVTGAFTTFGYSKCPSCDEYYDGKI